MQGNRWKGKSYPSEAPFNGESRRSFLKLSTAALTVPLVPWPRENAAEPIWIITPQPVFPPSPATTPWLEELPAQIKPVTPVSTMAGPVPTLEANVLGGEAGRAPHQRYDEIIAARGQQPELYELSAEENDKWITHPDLQPVKVWAYHSENPADEDATVPATIFARYGTPILCRMHNKLPEKHSGFGIPHISTHLHNLHCPSESDGFPGDFYSEHKAGPTLEDHPNEGKGTFRDHFYPNIYAGFDELNNGIGDYREALGTLFFHDHTLDFTAPNVYRGLVGFYLLFDHLDSGDEHDTSETALRLPSHPYDYPLAFGDRRFSPLPTNELFFDPFHVEGVLGDKIVVNGKIEPFLRVARRKYRLRLLNSGTSRFYEFYLVDSRDRVQRFTYIANDGNLLPKPLKDQTRVRLGVAERADIVVDFSSYGLGTELYLVNRLRQDSTRGPRGVKAPGTRVLKLIVDRDPPVPDVSRVPDELRPLRELPTPEEIDQLPVRRWEFDRKNGLWKIDGQVVDVRNPRAVTKQGTAEVWELVSESGGWYHPIHIHFEEGRILSKTVDDIEVPVPPHEQGRKDVFVLEQTMTIRILLRFRDFHGRYVMHCHNVIHEDHAMMVRWDIDDDESA
ncbi:multicopper oxidase domain-containing protein [Pseudomonas sp. MOB-449]|nr:multicopper oxidase domain-containing protein [Pseudomonas sp. MOB-449]